jgi:hypothetical protein
MSGGLRLGRGPEETLVMLGIADHLVPACTQRMRGDELSPVKDPHLVLHDGDLDTLADDRPGDGVAIGLQRDEGVAGDGAYRDPFESIGSHRGNREESLVSESIGRDLMGRAVHPLIRDRQTPLEQVVVEFLYGTKRAPLEGVAFHVLDCPSREPHLDLTAASRPLCFR